MRRLPGVLDARRDALSVLQAAGENGVRIKLQNASFCALAGHGDRAGNLGRKRAILQYLAALNRCQWCSKCKFFNGGNFMLQSSRRIAILTALLLTAAGALAQSTPATNSYDINV